MCMVGTGKRLLADTRRVLKSTKKDCGEKDAVKDEDAVDDGAQLW